MADQLIPQRAAMTLALFVPGLAVSLAGGWLAGRGGAPTYDEGWWVGGVVGALNMLAVLLAGRIWWPPAEDPRVSEVLAEFVELERAEQVLTPVRVPIKGEADHG